MRRNVTKYMRKQTEGYWRIRIAAELKAQGYDTPALLVLGHTGE